MVKNKDNAKSAPLLSTKNQQILFEQVFNDDGPGTILHDFEKILDFIGPDGIDVGGKYKFFPLKLMDFDSFSSCILDAFDFDDDHLYMFSYRNRFGMLENLNHPYMEEPPDASKVLIGELSLKPGAAMNFLFDFGDNWKFDVKLERIDPADKKIKGPVVLESHGEAPDQYSDWDDF